MSDDNTEQLIVLLEAKVDNFEKQMKKAAQTADQGFGSIENRAKQTADLISKNLESAANGVGGGTDEQTGVGNRGSGSLFASARSGRRNESSARQTQAERIAGVATASTEHWARPPRM